MARDYRQRKPAPRSGGLSKQLLLVLVCFLCGYLSASAVDFASLGHWFSTQVLAQQSPPAAVKPAPQQAELPKPKLEFYTLLANEPKDASPPPANAVPVVAVQTAKAIPVTAPSSTTTKSAPVAAPLPNAAPVNQAPNQMVMGKDAYLVQIGAFKSRPEADKMKASLVLKGFLVNIAIIKQQNINWYRVSIGPYSSKTQAQKAQAAVVSSEHIVGMIRKMDA